MSDPFSPCLLAFVFVTIFHFSHSDRWSGFSLHSLNPNNFIIFSLLTCHLYILFRKTFLHDFCPFPNRIFFFYCWFELFVYSRSVPFIGYVFCKYSAPTPPTPAEFCSTFFLSSSQGLRRVTVTHSAEWINSNVLIIFSFKLSF